MRNVDEIFKSKTLTISMKRLLIILGIVFISGCVGLTEITSLVFGKPAFGDYLACNDSDECIFFACIGVYDNKIGFIEGNCINSKDVENARGVCEDFLDKHPEGNCLCFSQVKDFNTFLKNYGQNSGISDNMICDCQDNVCKVPIVGSIKCTSTEECERIL
jgi:hypothetical protein